ncbi:MAG: peroxiredoxin [Bacteroidales bacterium]|jgi:peroxiredoxin Q/BCP
MKNKINPGDKAPLFTLPDSGGQPISLTDFIGKKSLVVFFYPKDESYGCTKEACSFRDNYDEFKEAGAEVIGISTDDETSHSSFAAHHKLPFVLLSDKDNKVADLYGVHRSLGILPGRATFVIDREGVIRMNYSSQLNFRKHMDEAIALIKSLSMN